MKRRIAVDLDGVLMQTCAPDTFGLPHPAAANFCLKLHQEGYEIVILTSRLSAEFGSMSRLKQRKKDIEEWLNKHSIAFDEVYLDIGKPACTAYVDDRAVFCDPTSMFYSFANVLTRLKSMPT